MHKLLLGYDVEDNINNFHQGEVSIIICFGFLLAQLTFQCPSLSSGATEQQATENSG